MMNRNIPPVTTPIGHINMVKAEKHHLSNGIPTYVVDAGSQDVVKIEFVFDAGNWRQPRNLVASICVSMLEEGSRKFTGSEIAEKFDFYGAYLQLTVDQDYAVVGVVSLNRHLRPIMEVLEDMIKNSVFPKYELEVLIAKNKQKWLLENEKVRTLCQKKFTNVLFGDGHPYAVNNKLDDFDKINSEILIDFYQSFYHSANCNVYVAGNVDATVMQMLDEHFGGTDWERPLTAKISSQAHQKFINRTFSAVLPANKILPNSSPVKKHHVEKPDGIQSAIRIGKLWCTKLHDDYQALTVLTTILGGYFGSRLMTNIREEKGYTYGIGCAVLSLKQASYMVISTEVGNEYVEASLDEIALEMNRLRTELVPDDELETVRSYLLGEFLRDFDGPFALMGSFRSINNFNLDYSFYDKYLQMLRGITSAELMSLAQQYLDPDSFYTVVAGNTKR